MVMTVLLELILYQYKVFPWGAVNSFFKKSIPSVNGGESSADVLPNVTNFLRKPWQKNG
jgi:hypothetical protein